MSLSKDSREDSGQEVQKSDLVSFMEDWNRGEVLSSAIRNISAETILRSGLSARRLSLLDRWENIEPAGLDGSVPDREPLKKWIHDSESLLSFIVRLSREPDLLGSNAVNDLPIIDSISESDFIHEQWRWPWTESRIAIYKKPKKFDKAKLVKLGTIAGLGLIGLAVYFDEEE